MVRGLSLRVLWLFFWVVAGVLVSSGRGELQIPHVIGSHMVLQRGCVLPIWGWADPGQVVEVRLSEATRQATADENGRWEVQFPAMPASGPHTASISSQGTKIELVDILIGEVWVCSGQSNMQWSLGQSQGGNEAIAASANDQLRLLTVPNREAGVPLRDMEGNWQNCEPNTARPFSAVAYFFGQELQKELQVPVGLINSSWGGTRIEPWTPPTGILHVPGLESVYEQISTANQAYARDVDVALDVMAGWISRSRLAAAQGSPLPKMPELRLPPHPLAKSHLPTSLYNSMIHPLVPFGIRGALWYQGESNNGEGMLYYQKMQALIKGWRNAWGQGDFPFYYVQLAPWSGYADGNLEGIWEAQLASLQIPATGMAVTTDLVHKLSDIHPINKQDVGHRLALWALAKTYGRQKSVFSGPIYRAHEVQGSRIRVEFDYAQGGLAARDGMPLSHFEIGDDTHFVPAQAVVDGEAVVVSSGDVLQPRHVRFGWQKTATPNLVNRSGLPASPFRTNCDPPRIVGLRRFSDPARVRIDSGVPDSTIRYTVDGTTPTLASPRYDGEFGLTDSATVNARLFTQDGRSSLVASQLFTRVPPMVVRGTTYLPGLNYQYYEGAWKMLPNFEELTPIRTGVVDSLSMDARRRSDFYGFTFTGSLRIPQAGAYTFYLNSDDGARLSIDGRVVAEYDGVHPAMEKTSTPLELREGIVAFDLQYFESAGSEALEVQMAGPGTPKRRVGPEELFHPR